jgi:hypothetical protein
VDVEYTYSLNLLAPGYWMPPQAALSTGAPATVYCLPSTDYDHDHRSAGAELITITRFYPDSCLNTEHPPSQGLRRGELTPGN